MDSIKDLPWRQQNNTELFQKHITQLLQAQENQQDAKQERLLELLSQTIRYSKKNVPFYEKRLNGLNPEALSLQNFEKITPLSKNDIRSNEQTLISREFLNTSNRMFEFRTSGSTGTPMRVFRGQRNLNFAHAISLYYHIFHKRDFSLCNVNVITSHEHRLVPGSWAPCMQTGPGYTLKIDESSATIFDYLLELKPNYLQTHPSTLKRLIDISLERNQKLEQLKEVRTFGEILEPGIKQSCKKNWQVDVANNYSSEEFATIALSCPYGDHHHVIDENVYLEVVDENNQRCKPGEIGKVLVTQLKNLAMPLIRYEIGDMACLGKTDECHINLPVLKRIEGRVRNLVVMPDGDTFHPVFDEEKILRAAPVKRYQVIQKTLESIVVNIEGKPFSPDQENALRNVFSEVFKDLFQISFIYHDNIPFSNRNKFELFKTELKP